MKNLKYLAVAALLAGTVAIGTANAEGNKTSSNAGTSGTVSSQSFKTMDTNKDGVLSEAEYSAKPPTSEDFSQVDANGDGHLTLSELQTAPTNPTAKPAAPSRME